jgi:hypothetical protein
MWLDRPDQWDKLAEHLKKAGEFGIDTETYGQPDKTSPQHRARVHCWSVGLLSETRSPRGFKRGVGRVLPRDALFHGSIRSVLRDTGIRKWAHNAPHDRHALENEGVEIRGLEDSLQALRVACPGRKDYGLKSAEQWALGYDGRPTFVEMVSYQKRVCHARRVRERGCICGGTPCRARTNSDWLDVDGVWRPHLRVEWLRFTPTYRDEPARYDVRDFVPGATLEPLTWAPTKDKKQPPVWWKGVPLDRWQEWLKYSLADAVRGMELVDWMRGQKPARLVYPWTTSSSSTTARSLAT